VRREPTPAVRGEKFGRQAGFGCKSQSAELL
jgi:hypothetical protein